MVLVVKYVFEAVLHNQHTTKKKLRTSNVTKLFNLGVGFQVYLNPPD